MSQYNSSDDDEQMARDMQLAYELQDKEERHAQRRRKRGENHSALEDGFSRNGLNADHMLFVACTMDSRPVELLVDTGASSSAMSMEMVQKLGLESKLNSNICGNAKGVGSSTIVGIVENVDCMIGHVEFRLFFMVLEGHMPFCILGLDQMRRFKCQVDLDTNVLVFGGKDGVQVPFMPQEQAKMAAHKMMNHQPTSTAVEKPNYQPTSTAVEQQPTSTAVEQPKSGMLKNFFRKG
jgi:predicted aspartyl protease